MGTRQTEIDAAIALRPDDLDPHRPRGDRPFFDETLADRIEEAAQEWLDEAQEIVDNGMDGDREQLLADAEDKLGQARTLIDEVGESLQTSYRAGRPAGVRAAGARRASRGCLAQRAWHDPGQLRLGLR